MLFGKRIGEATLATQTPDGRPVSKPLSLPISVLGSRLTAEVCLAGESVWPSHAAIIYDGQDFWIRDLVTPTGTFVDREPVGERNIHDGGEVRIGDHTLIFRLGDPHLTRPVWPQRLPLCAISIPGLSEQRYLDRVVTVIGSREGCDLVLSHASVDPIHALLVRTCRGLWLHDMASTNGSNVNRRRCDQKLLTSGDEIEIGPFAFTISILRPGSAADRGLSDSLMVSNATLSREDDDSGMDSSMFGIMPPEAGGTEHSIVLPGPFDPSDSSADKPMSTSPKPPA